MTRRRWIADEVSGDRATLLGAHADHLSRVLRGRIGDEFDIVADGVPRQGRVASIVEGRVEFELGETLSSAPASSITLLLSIFKFDRMEWAIEKATELGVAHIVPVIARRTEVHLAHAAAKRVERWRRIILQASEQSRRATSPEIAAPIKLRDAVMMSGSVRLLLDETERNVRLQDALSSGDGALDALLAFGPEGGWTDEERTLFHESGWISVSLGPNVLRAETAVIAATAIVAAELEN